MQGCSQVLSRGRAIFTKFYGIFLKIFESNWNIFGVKQINIETHINKYVHTRKKNIYIHIYTLVFTYGEPIIKYPFE